MAYKYMPRTVPYEQCSEVYKRYAEVEGVRASFVKDFRLNDSVAVDVVLLEATDSAGWVRLQVDFDVPIVPKEYEDIFFGENADMIIVKLFPKDKLVQQSIKQTIENDVIAISYSKRAISHYEISNEDQLKIVAHKLYDDNLN